MTNELSKNELWKALKDPVQKNCLNCKHDVDDCYDAVGDCWVLDTYPNKTSKWEWN